MSTLTELGAYLVTKGIGVLGTTLFLGPLPMSAPSAVVVRMLSGSSPIRTMGASLSVPVADSPEFQVMIRYIDHDAGELKVKAVIDVLDFYYGVLAGTPYLLTTLAYGPIYLGLDENNRHQWSTVFRAVKRRS